MAKSSDGNTGETLTFPHLVKWVEMVTRAQAERAMRKSEISGSQLFVLVLLSERVEATSAELSRMMLITPQALTMLLKPLRENGYITRRTDEMHARRLQLRLTDKGQKAIDGARSLGPQIEDELLSDFSKEERATLKRLLAKIARRFE